MSAYVEIVSAVSLWRFELTDDDLREIEEFTRENVSRWMDSSHSHTLFEIGIYGYEDFHAVCGDIDIPWVKGESSRLWQRIYPLGYEEACRLARKSCHFPS
jgi:hypothetical protein